MKRAIINNFVRNNISISNLVFELIIEKNFLLSDVVSEANF